MDTFISELIEVEFVAVTILLIALDYYQCANLIIKVDITIINDILFPFELVIHNIIFSFSKEFGIKIK